MNTEAFIREILNRPPIWMSKHPKHKHKSVIKKLWEEIKENFADCEVEQLKKEWENLKDIFQKELKMQTSSSGDPNIVTESQWKYFDLLTFLKEEFTQTEVESCLNEDETNEEINISSLSDAKFLPSGKMRSPPQPYNSQLPPCNKKAGDIRADDISSIPESPPPATTTPLTSPLTKSSPAKSVSPAKPHSSCEVLPYLSNSQLSLRKRKESDIRSPSQGSLLPGRVSPQPSNSKASPTPKRKASDIRVEYLEIERRKLKVLEEEWRRNMQQNTAENTDDYYFLMSLLPEMQKLTLVQKIRLRNKINQALMDEISEENRDAGNGS